MSAKFSMPRFPQEDLDSTQEMPELPEEFEIIDVDPIPDYIPEPPKPKAPEPQRPRPQPKAEAQSPYELEEELPEDFIDIALGFLKLHWKKVLLALCALVLVIVATVIGLLAARNRDPYDEKILNNVMIGNVLVGGMTRDQAVAALNASLASTYATQSMVVELGEEELVLEAAQVGAKLNVTAAVDAAYAYGRSGTKAEKEQAYQLSLTTNHILALLPYLELNEDYIKTALEEIRVRSVSALTQPSYVLEGDASNFTTNYFDPSSSGQTLVLTMGTPQIDFDAEAVYTAILDGYSLGQFRIQAQGPTLVEEPGAPDLNAIYNEFYIAPVEPTLDMTSFNTIPGSFGREFDYEAAEALVMEAQYGQELRIPMVYPAPESDPAAVLYRDVLGQKSTALPADETWKQNAKLACKAVNGLELMPGESFSFNAVVGQRSEERGYGYAMCGQNEECGAGVCQVASTVYMAALLSDLEISSRTPHSAPPSYTDYGLEAQVSGDSDLVFRNDGIYPLRLEAEISGGNVVIRIIGTDLRDYTVELESSVSQTIQPKIIYEEYDADNEEGYEDGDVIQPGTNGYEVKTYKRKYSKQTKKLISRDYISTTSYASQDKIIAQVAPTVETQVPTLPASEAVDGVGDGVIAVG